MSPTAQALGSLRDLEELLLPTGDGIQQVARLIVRQCLQLQRLRVLVFHHTLDDDSVMEIGEFPSGKGFPCVEAAAPFFSALQPHLFLSCLAIGHSVRY